LSGKRVLLDGFPRSPENAKDLITLCGKPELALHLVCDDTILMERIMTRGVKSLQQSNASCNTEKKHDSETSPSVRREDDNFYAALKRLRTFHEHHNVTMEWLRNQQVPIINLDCTGSPESVWQQLVSIGRLMRPAVKLDILRHQHHEKQENDWSNDPNRSSDDPEEKSASKVK
jgi:adenylate kinase